MENPARQQGGYAWLPVLIVVAVLGLLGGGSTLYQNQLKRQVDNEKLQQEMEVLKQQTAELEQIIEETKPSNTPTLEPSQIPTPKVEAATTSAPKPITQPVKSVTSISPPDTQPKLTKKEECEAEALKARLEAKEQIKLASKQLKKEISENQKMKDLVAQKEELYQQIQNGDYGGDFEPNEYTNPLVAGEMQLQVQRSLISSLEQITSIINMMYDAVDLKLAPIPDQRYEKTLSDCLNMKE